MANEGLDDLYEKLASHISSEQHKRAIKAADESAQHGSRCIILASYNLSSLSTVLAVERKNEDIQREAITCKIVANIQLAQYDAALALIVKHASLLGNQLVFEKVGEICSCHVDMSCHTQFVC